MLSVHNFDYDLSLSENKKGIFGLIVHLAAARGSLEFLHFLLFLRKVPSGLMSLNSLIFC